MRGSGRGNAGGRRRFSIFFAKSIGIRTGICYNISNCSHAGEKTARRDCCGRKKADVCTAVGGDRLLFPGSCCATVCRDERVGCDRYSAVGGTDVRAVPLRQEPAGGKGAGGTGGGMPVQCGGFADRADGAEIRGPAVCFGVCVLLCSDFSAGNPHGSGEAGEFPPGGAHERYASAQTVSGGKAGHGGNGGCGLPGCPTPARAR